jgi:hypothetical protein
LEAISNSKQNLTSNSKKQTDFEFGQNLLGVQTCLKNFDKFSKILICLSLPECEFILVEFYGPIWGFHTSSIGLGLKTKERKI